MTIGLYDGHAFLTSKKSRKTTLVGLVRLDSHSLATWFVTQVVAPEGKPKSTAPTNKSVPLHQHTSEPFIQTTVAVLLQQNGLSGRQSSGAFTSIMEGVVMGVSDTFSMFQLMVITPRPTLSSNTMVVIGTAVRSATRLNFSKMRWCEGTKRAIQPQGRLPMNSLWREPSFFETLVTLWLKKWEHEAPSPWMNTRCPEKKTATYPYAIVYDFESYQDKTKAACPTRDLSYGKRARTHLRIHCGHIES